jgi:UDP-N-acetylglucosamine 1-carboxyvinyltransferase
MEQLIIQGGKKLQGAVNVSGAKNVAVKALIAACLTDEEVVIHNVPRISDVFVIIDLIRDLGGKVTISDHTVTVVADSLTNSEVHLEKAGKTKSSSLFIAPLLARLHEAIIPNPGGCRIGARPIDRTIDGLRSMGAEITYHSEDGYFHAKSQKLKGTSYCFEKNTHTGTETLIMAGVMAEGVTTLENAAEEPEVDELINLLNSMGARIARREKRTIVIEGVSKLHGTTTTIGPDRNEIVTLAIAAIITEGDIFIKDITPKYLSSFLEKLTLAGGGFEVKNNGIRFFFKGELLPTDVVTSPHPGFMTDWQSPWAVLMTKANGISNIHEAVYESRFSYVEELRKMGAKIDLFNPEVSDPKTFYNFNPEDDKKENYHGARIHGPTPLHNGVVTVSDLRAGATLVLAALAATGKSSIFGVKHLDRGYEKLDTRLTALGADIVRRTDE